MFFTSHSDLIVVNDTLLDGRLAYHPLVIGRPFIRFYAAARLMVSWIMSGEGQSFIVNLSGQYPANKQVRAKPGRPALSSIKTFKEDPATVEKQADQIKAQYAKYFKV